MAEFSDLPLHVRIELALYKWRRIDPVPWTPLPVPLREARIALVTSGGLYRLGEDEPFRRVKGGDTSFRVLPNEMEVEGLALGQTSGSFDREPILEDRNMALPVDRLAELVRLGEIGSAAHCHVSFSGSITAPKRLVDTMGPEVAKIFRDDGVQAALLVPI
jgi:D-proline reductase (dithiol) PrdB